MLVSSGITKAAECSPAKEFSARRPAQLGPLRSAKWLLSLLKLLTAAAGSYKSGEEDKKQDTIFSFVYPRAEHLFHRANAKRLTAITRTHEQKSS
jgi:hypothetical protein